MSESRPVSLVLRLPSELADEVERVQQTDPEFLERVVEYGIVRKAIFDRLQGAALHRPPTTSFKVS